MKNIIADHRRVGRGWWGGVGGVGGVDRTALCTWGG